MSLEHMKPKISAVSSDYGRGLPLPWWIKMLGKMMLSRIPVSYRTWRNLGLFRHGDLDVNAGRVIKGWQSFSGLYREITGRWPRTALELGPGDSVGRALCAAADGAERTWLIDVADFATHDMTHYREIARQLAATARVPLNTMDANDRGELLGRCRARYLTRGLESFSEVRARGVDLIFSHSVMEHLPLQQFDAFLSEMFRVLSAGGMAIHRVDLQDHLGGRLEHLRLPRWFWENPIVAHSGFYTNRLRYPDIVERAHRAGFETAIPSIKRWIDLPTPPSALHREFQIFSSDDLQVCGFTIVMLKPAQPPRKQ